MSDVAELHPSHSSVPRAALFSARFFAASPIKQITQSLKEKMLTEAMRVAVAPVPCPQCGTVLAVLVRSDQNLYRPGADRDTLGAPYSLDRRARVEVRCRACDVRYMTSGRSVARNLIDGSPPLAA